MPLRPKSPKPAAVRISLSAAGQSAVQPTYGNVARLTKSPTDLSDKEGFGFSSPELAASPPTSPKPRGAPSVQERDLANVQPQAPEVHAKTASIPSSFQDDILSSAQAQSPPQLLSPPSIRRQDCSKRVAFSPTQDEQPFDSTAPYAAVQVNIT